MQPLAAYKSLKWLCATHDGVKQGPHFFAAVMARFFG